METKMDARAYEVCKALAEKVFDGQIDMHGRRYQWHKDLAEFFDMSDTDPNRKVEDLGNAGTCTSHDIERLAYAAWSDGGEVWDAEPDERFDETTDSHVVAVRISKVSFCGWYKLRVAEYNTKGHPYSYHFRTLSPESMERLCRELGVAC